MNNYNFILASSSPRRKEILEKIGINFDIITSDINEQLEIDSNLLPINWVKAVSEKKAQVVFNKIKNNINKKTIIISADTIVVYMDKILHKPKNKSEAREMMKILSGNKHNVYTSVSLFFIDDINDLSKVKIETFVNSTSVFMNNITDEEIECYINTNEPYDKAGGYGIQGKASLFINRIEGDYYNVVGFPISNFYKYLKNNCINILNI